MRRHHEVYRELSVEAKSALLVRAEQLSGAKASAELQKVVAQLQGAREERSQRSSQQLPGLPNTVDACRYDDAMIKRFLEVYHSLESCSFRWVLEPERVGCPGVPEMEAQVSISDEIKRLGLGASSGRPWWAGMVCDHREEFINTALVFQRPECSVIDGPAFVPLHVSQRPDTVHFVKVVNAHGMTAASLQASLALSSHSLDSFNWVWHIDSATFGQDMLTVASGFDDEAIIHVIPHIVFAGHVVLARSEAVPFDEFVMGLPKLKKSKKSKEGKTGVARTSPDIVAKIREEYPWFTDDDISSALTKVSSRSEARCSGSHSCGSGGERREVVVVPLGEDEAAQAVVELQAHRDMWQWDEQEEVLHFYVQARGDASTKARCGKATDCVATFARSHVKPWCRAYSCNVMRSFAFSTHISEHICHVLAREWCAKQNYYYQAWLDAGQLDNFDFSAIEPFRLSDAFMDVLGGVPATSQTLPRFLELSEWLPTARVNAV